MVADTGILYTPDSIDPDYNLGVSVSLGGGVPAAATIVAGATNTPGATPGCLTCGSGFMGISWPLIIIIVAVLVLALRD